MRKTLTSAVAAAVVGLLGSQAYAQQPQPLAAAPDFDKVVIKTTDLGNRTYIARRRGRQHHVAWQTTASSWWTAISRRCTTRSRRITAITQPADPLSPHHPFSPRPQRRQRGVSARTAPPSWRTRASGSSRQRTRNGLTGNVVPPAPPIALPKETFKDTMTVRLPRARGRAPASR